MAQTSKIELEVEKRTDTGKNACGRLRREAKVPGNVYGLNKESFAVTVNPKKIESLLLTESGRNTIFKLSLGGGQQSRDVLLRELQRDPVTDRLVHVDFLRIDPKKSLQVRVPVRLLGLATGVKNEGGVLDFVNREVEVSCLPDRIPEHLDIDVSELHVGQHLSVKDLPASEGVEYLDDPDSILLVIAAPQLEEEEPTEDAEEAAAEPTDAAESKSDE